MYEGELLICFERSSRWYAPAIRWATDSYFNHVFIAYQSDVWGGWLAADIMIDGVRPIVLKKPLSRKGSEFEFYKCKVDLNSGLKKTRDYIGAPYDALGLVPILFNAYMYTRYNKQPKKIKTDRSRIHCSEFVSMIFKNAELPGTRKMIPYLTSPGRLREYVRTQGEDMFERTKNPLKIQQHTCKLS